MMIIATVGLNSLTEKKISKIILAGADVIRYNFSHRIISDNIEHVKLGKRIIDNLNSQVQIMIDLPTNKIRLGNFDSIFYSVREEQELILKSAPFSPDCNEFIPIETEKIGTKININQTITMGDGEVAFQILDIIDKDTVKAKALNNGAIRTMKTFNAGLYLENENYITYCKKILEKVLSVNPDFLAISYIKNLNEKLINDLELKKLTQKIIIKIESEISEQEIEYLYQEPLYRMVIIDLGELGVNMPFGKIGNFYKKIISIAKMYQKPTLVMTQLLESTINNYIPNRAEIINLTNMIKDGIKGIILGRETALGARPSYTINVAKKIIKEVQQT